MAITKSSSKGHELVFIEDEKIHEYTLDGSPVIGVSDVKKAYPISEGLLQYKIKQGIEEHKTNKKLLKAASIGSVMHDYIHSLRLNLPFDMSKIDNHPDRKILLKRKDEAHKWIEKQGRDKVLSAEQIVAYVCPLHRGWVTEGKCACYAGKYDVAVEREGLIIIQDYKSSKGFFVDQFIQGGGYSNALLFWNDIKADGIEIIRFHDNTPEPESHTLMGRENMQWFEQEFLTLRDSRRFQHKWEPYFDEMYRKANPYIKVKK